ncbi:uncharacterized protein LOC124204646 [Daphnia pulex]|uniref:uncharacterized protein LOC124204646 n=1 Tax=Daphnia pulex TaxID=6669 RepID=UPI001EDDEB75|nr:uncharacterized protein LOC124204646 [Daphnia pulex]
MASVLHLIFTLIALNICSSDALQSVALPKQSTDDASVEDLKEKVDQLTEILKQQGELLKYLANERKADERKADESKSGSTIGKVVEAASWAYFGYETAKELCHTNVFDGFSLVSRIKKYACPSKKFFSG